MSFKLKHMLFLISCFLLILINSTGPFQNISGNYRARFALTKSIVDDHTIRINKYKDFIGYDQAIYNGDVFCTHNPGMSIMMALPYYLLAKPITYLLPKDLSKKSVFVFQSWVSKISVIMFLFYFGIFYLLKIMQTSPSPSIFFSFSLLTSTLILPYSVGPFADIISVLLQFPIIYHLYISKKKWSKANLLTIFLCLLFLFLNKPTNIILGLGYFIAYYFLYNRISSLLILTMLLFTCIQLYYNQLVDGNLFTFVVQYFAPNGVKAPFDQLNMIMQFPALQKPIEMLFSRNEGLILFNPVLLTLFLFPYRLLKKYFLLLLPTILLFVFFLFFRNWNLGADFGWRNGIVLIPAPLVLVIIYWNSHTKFLTTFKVITFLTSVRYILPFLFSPVIDYNYRNNFNEDKYLWELLFNRAPDNLFGNTSLSFLSYFTIILTVVFFSYATLTYLESLQNEKA